MTGCQRGLAKASIAIPHVRGERRVPVGDRDTLIVQAKEIGVPVVTADPAMSAYDVAVLW
jgi:hypothetical protein